jgi:hypothetical protein
VSVIVTRAPEISLNGRETWLGDDNKPLKFVSAGDARKALSEATGLKGASLAKLIKDENIQFVRCCDAT